MITILNTSEKKKFLEQLKEQFGIEEMPYLLIESGKEKIRGFSGNLSRDELSFLSREINVETIGCYLFKIEKQGLRLSFDAPLLLNPKENIIEISDEEAISWLKGKNLEYSGDKKGFVVIKNKDYFLGCGKASEGRITNFVPKERRLRG